MERKRFDVKRVPSGAAVLQPNVTNALRRALFEEWAEHGYQTLSLERVAKRAGVGKAALYRRWGSKSAMVTEALETVAMTITETPDTGTLNGDVYALLKSFRRVLRHRLVRRIVPDLQAERGRSDELEAVLVRFTAARRARGTALIERAVARGEIPGSVDMELALDLLAAPIYWRIIITRAKAGTDYLHRSARAVCAALKAS